MHYRMASAHDLPQLAQLRWDFRMEDGLEQPVVGRDEFVVHCIEFLRRGLDSGIQTYWLAEREGEIIAHLFVHRIDLVPRPCKLHDQFGYITNHYTRPAYRHQGTGSELLRRVTEWAREQDMELLIVYPSIEAVLYYVRAGFQADNEVMELKLREYYSPDWAAGSSEG